MEVIFSGQAFKEMILFSGRFANHSIPEEDWKEVYGFLVGKIIEGQFERSLYVSKMIPMIHGTRSEVSFNEREYGLSEMIIGELHKSGHFICGWYHTHPGLELFLSDIDVKNQLGFQTAFENAVAAVFDFTKISDSSSGLKLFRLDDPQDSISSSYSEVPYNIEAFNSKDSFIASSLADISEKYETDKPLIKEAGEIYEDLGNLDSIFNALDDIDTDLQEDFKFEEGDLNQTIIENNDLDFKLTDFSDSDSSTVNNFSTTDLEFNDIVEEFSESDWELRTLRERIEYSKKNGEPAGYFMIKLANRLISKTVSTNEALKYLESAEEEFNASDDLQGLAAVYNEIGLFYEERGNYYSSLNNFESSFEILRKLEDYYGQIKVLNNIGNIYLKTKEHGKAFAKFKEAFSLSSQINFHYGMNVSLNNTVEVLIFLKNFKLAYDILIKNYYYFRDIDSIFGVGTTFSKLGILYFSIGSKDYKICEEYFKNALKIKNSNNFIKETLDDWIYLSKIYVQLGNFKLAEDNLIQGLNIARTYDLTKDEGIFYKNLGDLFRKLKNNLEMVSFYEMAIDNFLDFDDEDNLLQIYEVLGSFYLDNENNLEKSLNLYYKILKIYRNHDNQKKIANTLTKIANIHIDLMDNKSAIECLEEAEKIFLSLFDNYNSELVKTKIFSIKEYLSNNP